MFPTKRKQEDSFLDIHDMTHLTPPKQNDTDTPSASAGGHAEKIPLTLYNAVQLALEANNVFEAKRTKISASDLDFAENLLCNIAISYKSKKLLPFGWEYNPDNASTLEPKDDTILLWLNGKTRYPSTKLLKVNDVPLSSDVFGSWLQFKSLDESTPKSCLDRYDIVYPLSTEHPFVSSVGCFAVDGYNEAFELFVEQGNYTRLRRPTFSEVTYYIMEGSYCFNMTIVADEDGFIGIYDVMVYCCCVDGKRTLKQFKLKDVKQGKKRRASKLKSPKGVCLPVINSYKTGMCHRRTINGITYGLYDYVDPSVLAG